MPTSRGLLPQAGSLLVRPFQRFFQLESASGLLLIGTAVLALVWANSPAADAYFALWGTVLTLDIGVFAISKPLLLWVNDGLMAVFFFVVGLELKREVMVGELSDPKQASLSVAAAIGGMILPAGLYFLVNAGGPGAGGWGIPMATDIAFALGVLALLGRRVPTALKIFVTAVAIVDDLGAVLVIALFYTAELSLGALGLAAVLLLGMVVLNRTGVRSPWAYAALGFLLWVALLKSGVHATIAGVLGALTIPASQKIDAGQFLERARGYLAEIAEDLRPGAVHPTRDQRDAVHSLNLAANEFEPPLTRLEHTLHPIVAFVVMPIFALANAGVALGGDIGATLTSPIALGIVVGLFFGKQLGVLLAAFIATRLGLATLPAGVGWRHLWGVSLLCGIGFTMSLFIASLAFTDPDQLDTAKIGILAASLLSGIVGALVLMRAPAPPSGVPVE